MDEEIILYRSPGCPGSEAARAYLAKRGIAYVERNVEEDPEALEQLRALNVFATPCLKVRGHVMVGFDPEEFERLFADS